MWRKETLVVELKRNWSKVGLPLIYLAAAGLLFSIGVVCGRFALSPSAAPTPGITYITPPPGPTAAPQSAAQPIATSCVSVAPVGWAPYTIQPGDTLSTLAARFQVSQGRIMKVNCLASPDDLQAGQVLYLPPLLTPTPCTSTPPAGWSLYTVQSGDTLSSLTGVRGVTTDEVIRANCLTSPDLVEGQSLSLPALPTPTPCAVSPPPGWELYTVQSGDTLFNLAATRGTTTAEVLQVNCLTSPIIAIGQTLYLPALPTPTSTSTEPPPTPAFTPVAQLPPVQPAPPAPAPQPPPSAGQISAADYGLNGERNDLPKIGPVWSGAPGAGSNPCEVPPPGHSPGEPWISSLSLINRQTQHGRRAYFFACEFIVPTITPEPETTWTAEIHHPDGVIESLDVQLHLPPYFPDYQRLEMGTAEAVVVWNALCDLPRGEYTLSMRYGQREAPPFTFELTDASSPKILTVPRMGAPGTTFQIYYCHFPPDTMVTINLYYQAARLITPTLVVPECTDPRCTFVGPAPGILWASTNQWNVYINSAGWATHFLPSSPYDLGVAYLLVFDEKQDGLTEAEDVFWLSR
jgi:LysM repeat protein